MSRHIPSKKLLMSSAGFFVLLLLLGGSPLFAQDNSNSYATFYETDNNSDGFTIGNPQDAWRGLDMIYFHDYRCEVFFKPYNYAKSKDTISLRIALQPGAEAPWNPGFFKASEEGQTYSNTNRRHSAVRFAAFQDKLYLYYGKTYDGPAPWPTNDGQYSTGFILWERSSTDTGQTWSGGTNLWERRPGNPADTDANAVVQGLVVKVMPDVNDPLKDKVYILVQIKSTHDLYLLTYDGTTHSAPEKIFTFPGNDCILNGDTFSSDGKQMIAFVTKDDALGSPTGLSKVYVFDPAEKSVTLVSTFADKWKDLAVVQGALLGCSVPSNGIPLQIWGIPWGSDALYHMQFILSADGKSGSLNPAAHVKASEGVSSHVDSGYRGYLSAVRSGSPEYAWVWWWGSTTIANAYGHSLRYPIDSSVPGAMPAHKLARQFMSEVSALNLPRQVKNSYIAHLKKVRAFIENMKIRPAIRQLDAFMRRVQSDIDKGRIDESVGYALLQKAWDIVEKLE